MSAAKRAKEKEPRHVRLYHWLLRTEAWTDLDPVARALYVELVARYSGTDSQGFSNNGRIPLSLLEAAATLHSSKQTAMRAFARLKDHGFIAEVRRGSFNTKVRHASEWRITEFPCDGKPPTKDFASWRKSEPGSTSKPERVSRRNRTGFQVEQSQKVTMGYGSTTTPVKEIHGSTTTPLVVYQGEGSTARTRVARAAVVAPPHMGRVNESGQAGGPIQISEALASSPILSAFGQRILPEVLEMIQGTGLDNDAYRDKLKSMPGSDQFKAARRDLTHERRRAGGGR